MVTTNTTRFLVTNTARLRSWTRRVDPYSAAAIAVLATILVSGMIRSSMAPAPAIIIVATQALPAGQHGTARRLDRAPAAQNLLPTAIVPTAAPLSTVEPVQAEPVYQVQSAPEPTAAPAWHADPQIVTTDAGTTAMDAGPPAGAPRYCTGFGDSRDYDAMYASSPVCNGGTP